MKLLIFGYGFSSRALVQALPDGWQVTATTRSAEKAAVMQSEGVTPRLFPGDDLSET